LTNPYQEKSHKSVKSERLKIFVWTLFDFANTSYSIVIVTFLFAVYFKKIIFSSQPIGDFYWSIGTSLSMLITAIISPLLGAIADYSAGKKRFLLFFTMICIISSSLLYFVGKGDVILALVLFVLANVGFEAGLVFYDSFLPEITSPKNYGRVSGYGFAMGYLGSLFTLALIFPLINKGMIRESFPLSALVFLIFSLPLFLFLKETRNKREEKHSFYQIGTARVFNTITHLKNYKNLSFFLLAFFFYIEGVNTVIFFSGNYAVTTLHFSMEQLIIFFLIVQSTAIIGSLLFGFIADSYGQKKSLSISLVVWIFTIVFAFFTSDRQNIITLTFSKITSLSHKEVTIYCFYIVGLLAGSVMGATQSTSRGLMSKLTPFDRKTEFFGFYSFFGKSSAIVGPLIFGYVSFVTGQQRIAILTIAIFFVIGLIILKRVRDE
jgi:MFS transporter, UMF1 family